MNLKIASAIMHGGLDSHTFMQGMLAQCLTTMEKKSRGITTARGRPATRSDFEQHIIEEASLSLAVAGGNRHLAQSLGQRVTLPRVIWDDMPTQHSLPNPALALMTGKEEQLSDNVMMIDQRYPRSPSAPQRRLVLAVDHTYLQRMLCQAKVADEPGLVGGPWCPASEQDAFLPFKSMAEGCLNRPRACMMLECLVWDPAAPRKECLSLASMPMTLKRAKRADVTLVKQGNLES